MGRTITSVQMSRHQTVTWKRRSLMMSPVPIQCSSTVRGTRAPRTMVMDLRVSSARGSLHRTVTTFQERSKLRCARPMFRYCEKFSNIFPFPVEEQNCHFEPKKICELEMKTRPKKAKKYSYTKDCKERPREICDQCEKKSLKPVCVMQDRLVCTYEPEETCRDEEKQFCHKVEKVVMEEVCDMKFDTRYL